MTTNTNLKSSANDLWRQEIAKATYQVLTQLFPDAASAVNEGDIASAIEKPADLNFGDFALPCFRFAKALRKGPPEISAKLAAGLTALNLKWLEKSTAAGAFLNLVINKAEMSAQLLPIIVDGSFFKPQLSPAEKARKVMIEFSQPNTHKEFHVGHTRNLALGDSLVRLYRYLGYDVIAANYPGDEGAHVAKCLWYMKKQNLKEPTENKGEFLGSVYSGAVRALDEASDADKEIYKQEVSSVLHEIEKKSGPLFELWRTTRQWSLDTFYKIYAWFDVKFDVYFFESELSAESQEIVDQYLKKGVFVEDQGAIGVDLNPYGLGFLLLRKRDGNTLYATKDLVLARRKFEQFKINKSIYVVAAEQNLHFRQVFKTLELMGFAQAKDCFHLSYGLVLLPEGKMSSRAGTTISLDRLKKEIEQELEPILGKYAGEWTKEEIADTKNKLTIGAIRYGMLATDPVKDVVFNMKDWLSFEGDSGPYLMYTYARCSSILRKGEAGASGTPDFSLLKDSHEHVLIRNLYDFNEVVRNAVKQNKPSLLVHYLFDLCQSFNGFYSHVSVLKAESPQIMTARLFLARAFQQMMGQGLKLLGIVPPERM